MKAGHGSDQSRAVMGCTALKVSLPSGIITDHGLSTVPAAFTGPAHVGNSKQDSRRERKEERRKCSKCSFLHRFNFRPALSESACALGEWGMGGGGGGEAA